MAALIQIFSNISAIVLLARAHYAHAHNSTFIRLEHVPNLLMHILCVVYDWSIGWYFDPVS